MKRILIPGILIVCLLISCAANESANKTVKLKQKCIEATIKAIDAEIERHQTWLEQAEDQEEKTVGK
jgi:hypothetical protein